MSRRRWMLLAMLVVGLAPATIGPSSAYASAGFEIEHYALTATEKEGASPSPDDQAGSHPYELTAKAVLEPNAHSTGADEVKDLDFELPPGLIVNPAGVPQNSVIGTVEVSIAGKIVTAAVHNLARGPGEFARRGRARSRIT